MAIYLYQRYLAKTIILPFLITTTVISSIIWIVQALRYLHLLDKGIGLANFLELIILILPALLFIILPFLTIFSILYAYQNLAEERQFIILKNSAISNFSLALPALFIALIITLFAYYLSFSLMPKSYYRLRSKIDILKEHYITKIINEREFTQIIPGVILYIAGKSEDDVMHGIVLFDNRGAKNDNENNTVLFAKEGEFNKVNETLIFQLKNGYRQSYDVNNNLTNLTFDNLTFELRTPPKNNDRGKSKHYKEYKIKELYKLYKLNPNNKILIELHQRIIWPIYTLFLTFVALSIWLKAPYNRERNINIFYIIVIVITLISYIHFACLNMAVTRNNFIYLCYVNIIIWSIIMISLFITDDNAISRYQKIYRAFRK